MATYLKQMINNLLDFYDFNNKKVISIGAGGQFYEYAQKAREVIAVDNEQTGLDYLEVCLQRKKLLYKFTLIHSDFYNFKDVGDVLMFDFCLHEILNPEKAILHAQSMTPDVLINDHWPDSEWAYITDEDTKVRKSWNAIQKFDPQRVKRFDTVQYFKNYDELYEKVKVQGNRTIKRIQKYKSIKDFFIPMSYGLVLIK